MQKTRKFLDHIILQRVILQLVIPVFLQMFYIFKQSKEQLEFIYHFLYLYYTYTSTPSLVIFCW